MAVRPVRNKMEQMYTNVLYKIANNRKLYMEPPPTGHSCVYELPLTSSACVRLCFSRPFATQDAV